MNRVRKWQFLAFHTVRRAQKKNESLVALDRKSSQWGQCDPKEIENSEFI